MILILIYKNSFGIDQKTFQYICFSINQLKFCNDMKIIKQKQIRFTWYLLNICGWFTCLLLFFFFLLQIHFCVWTTLIITSKPKRKETFIKTNGWTLYSKIPTAIQTRSSRKLKKLLHMEMQHMVRNFHIRFCKVCIYHWFEILG